MRSSSFASHVLVVLLLTAAVVSSSTALALEVIEREELKEMAIEYGRYAQRFVTCKVEPPTSINVETWSKLSR